MKAPLFVSILDITEGDKIAIPVNNGFAIGTILEKNTSFNGFAVIEFKEIDGAFSIANDQYVFKIEE